MTPESWTKYFRASYHLAVFFFITPHIFPKAVIAVFFEEICFSSKTWRKNSASPYSRAVWGCAIIKKALN